MAPAEYDLLDKAEFKAARKESHKQMMASPDKHAREWVEEAAAAGVSTICSTDFQILRRRTSKQEI